MELFPTDLLDPVSLAPALKDVEYIFHIAGVTKAKTSAEYHRGNVETTRALLRVASQVPTLKKFTLISSLAAVGPSPDGTPFDETASCNPITAYGRSKLKAEQIAEEFLDKVPCVILRPPAVYGPRDRDILEIFQWVRRGIIPLIGTTEKTLSLIHGVDLARGIIEATFSERTVGKTYFISEERIHTYSELVRFIGDIMRKKAIPLRLPSVAIWALAALTELAFLPTSKTPVLNLDKARVLLHVHWVCSPAKLKQDIGFETQISTHDGLLSTHDWYRAKGWL